MIILNTQVVEEKINNKTKIQEIENNIYKGKA